MDDDHDIDAPYWEDFESALWEPVERHGWTWVPKSLSFPELHLLLDADGELMGEVYQRFGRVICWAPFTWAEEAYRSEEDIGEYGYESEEQRERHFARIGASLSDWVRRKRDAGVDIPMLRDTHAYYFETGNGHDPMTVEESKFLDCGKRPVPAPSIEVGGWRAERAWNWHCEGHWIRDPSGQLRGAVQIRLGVVRAVAAQARDADEVDPVRLAERDEHIGRGGPTCRGQIVIQERLRPMANAFTDDERGAWLAKAVEAIRATPNPNRAWPPETLGAWGGGGSGCFRRHGAGRTSRERSRVRSSGGAALGAGWTSLASITESALHITTLNQSSTTLMRGNVDARETNE